MHERVDVAGALVAFTLAQLHGDPKRPRSLGDFIIRWDAAEDDGPTLDREAVEAYLRSQADAWSRKQTSRRKFAKDGPRS